MNFKNRWKLIVASSLIESADDFNDIRNKKLFIL